MTMDKQTKTWETGVVHTTVFGNGTILDYLPEEQIFQFIRAVAEKLQQHMSQQRRDKLSRYARAKRKHHGKR